jgi:hypothetical protein
MLYVVVLLAVVFYVVLFSAWSTFGPQLEHSAHTVASWRDVLFAVPDPNVLIWLKIVLMLAIAYLVFDACVAGLRRLLHGRPQQPSWKTHKLRDYSEPL